MLSDACSLQVLAEQQVRGQMDRIQALTKEREGMILERERERADRSSLQGLIAGLEEKNAQLVLSMNKAEESKQVSLVQLCAVWAS